MTNLISLLFNLKGIIFLGLLLLFAIYYDDGLKNDIKKETGINLSSKETKITNLNSDKIYKMYPEKFKVMKAVDGDTIHLRKVMKDENLENYTYKVRMMAVNTLEKDSPDIREKCLANLATQYTQQNLVDKFVYVYGDTTQPELDQYKRVLAYILIGGDTEFFNEKIMKTGFAKTYKASPPATEWKKYENIRLEMEKQEKGIWDAEICKI
jgi:endonuclease YncB( thermonuclease family)